MRCIWSDAMHMVRCCSCLYKKDRSDNKPMRCDAYGLMRCDAHDPMRFLFVQKRPVDNKPMRCGACGLMRCNWSDAVLVRTKTIGRITNRCDEVHIVRCCSCLYNKHQQKGRTFSPRGTQVDNNKMQIATMLDPKCTTMGIILVFLIILVYL